MSSTKRSSSPSTASSDSGLNETSLYSEIINELGVPRLNLDSDSDADLTPIRLVAIKLNKTTFLNDHPFSKSLKKPKGRLEMSSSPKTSQLTSEYEIITALDFVKKPVKPLETSHKSPKLVKCLKKLVKNVTSKPKPKHKLRRCESSVDVIRSHATQFRF